MNTELSPKRLQKSREFDQALQKFRARYYDALEEGDQFLSSLYMDEIVYTILLQKGQRIEESTLRELLADVPKQFEFGSEKEQDALQDTEIAVRKRFPERFKIEDEGKSEETG